MKKILLVSSSSGGHVYPCYVLGEELKKRGYEITYIGIENQIEEKIIPEITLFNIPNSFKRALTFKGMKKIILQRKVIKAEINKADIIIAFGGFITFLVAIINFKKKAIYTHEQNVILGDSIKYSSFFVDKIFTSFPIYKKENKKYIYTSNPTISNIKTRCDININKPKVMFVFGSLSSETCLEIVKNFLINTKLNNEFLLVTGEKYYSKYKHLNNKNIKVKSKINMKDELEYYDLVFTRAGATTLLEVLKSGVEIVCIPSPYVKNNHQEKNAKYFEKYISIIKEKDFTKENIEAHIVSMKRKNTYKIEINPIDKIIYEVEND